MILPDKAAYKLLHDATICLSQIEENGIRIDVDYLKATIDSVNQEIKSIKQTLQLDPIFLVWKNHFGSKTKLTAHKQLGTIIFDLMGGIRAPILKKKDENEDKESDAEAAFADIELPFVKEWFRMKKLEKAIQTYLPAILRETIDEFCHPFFNLNKAISYRSSSDRFNFQNIPIRNPEIAKLIRQCFIARKGCQIGEIDFSQIEVRGAAVYTHDPNLIDYIKNPKSNMHTDAAMDLFFLKESQVDKKTTRDSAKNQFVFPEFYGAVWFQQAPEIWHNMRRRKFTIPGTDTLVIDHLARKGITELGECKPGASPAKGTFAYHVKEVERKLWEERFPVYARWKRKWWEEYQRNGGFKYLTGFVCNGVFKRNEVLSFAIQGTAFHWLLWSLIQLHKWLRKNKMKTRIVGQIHDSIVADIYPPEKDDFLAKCKQVMTVDLPRYWQWICVPIGIEAELAPVGGSWYDKKEHPL